MSQMKIAGQNHIFPPLSIIMASNKKTLIIYLSLETIANKMH